MKRQTHFTIEDAVLLSFQSRVPDRERSKVIEEFMRSFAVVDEPTQEESAIEEEIDETRKRLEDERQRLTQKIAELAMARSLREQREKEQLERIKVEGDMIRRSGILERMG